MFVELTSILLCGINTEGMDMSMKVHMCIGMDILIFLGNNEGIRNIRFRLHRHSLFRNTTAVNINQQVDDNVHFKENSLNSIKNRKELTVIILGYKPRIYVFPGEWTCNARF